MADPVDQEEGGTGGEGRGEEFRPSSPSVGRRVARLVMVAGGIMAVLSVHITLLGIFVGGLEHRYSRIGVWVLLIGLLLFGLGKFARKRLDPLE